jgi:DNA polymerase-1
MIMQVHDELVFEAPVAERDALMALVWQEMEGVLKLAVPLHVEIAAGRNWDEAHT